MTFEILAKVGFGAFGALLIFVAGIAHNERSVPAEWTAGSFGTGLLCLAIFI